MLKNKSWWGIALCILPYQGFSQNPEKSIRFTTNPPQYYFTGYNITAEKVQKNLSYGLDVSFKPASCNGCEVQGGVGIFGEYHVQNMRNHNYNALTTSIHSKFYFKKSNRYLSPQLYFRYWWFENKNFTYDNVEGYRFSGLRNENQKLYGFKISYGRTKLFNLSSTTSFVLDMAIGAGFYIGTATFETRDGVVWNRPYDYLKENRTVMWPTAHVKIQIGLDIKQ